MMFLHSIKMYNFEPYNVLLAIATNIPVLLMTAFVTHLYNSAVSMMHITREQLR